MRRNNNNINERRSSSVLNLHQRQQNQILDQKYTAKYQNKSLYKKQLHKQIIDLENKTKKLQKLNKRYINLFLNSNPSKNKSNQTSSLSNTSVEPNFFENKNLPSINNFYPMKNQPAPLTNSVVFPCIYYNTPYGFDMSFRRSLSTKEEKSIDIKELKKDIKKIQNFTLKLENIEQLQKIQLTKINYLLQNKTLSGDKELNRSSFNKFEYNPKIFGNENPNLKEEINNYIDKRIKRLTREELYNNMRHSTKMNHNHKRKDDHRDHSSDNKKSHHHNHSYQKRNRNTHSRIRHENLENISMYENMNRYSQKYSENVNHRKKYPIKKNSSYSIRYHHKRDNNGNDSEYYY